MAKVLPKIVWQVGDGKVHEIPGGAHVVMVGTRSAASLEYDDDRVIVGTEVLEGCGEFVVARAADLCPICNSTLHEVPQEAEVKACIECPRLFRIE